MSISKSLSASNDFYRSQAAADSGLTLEEYRERVATMSDSDLARYHAERGKTGRFPTLPMAAEAGARALPKAGPKSAQAPTYSASDIAAAVARGVAQERARVAAVFDCLDSRGRERGCVTLLTHSKGWSAASIVANLSELPTDAELGAKASQEESDAVWSSAHAVLDADRAQARTATDRLTPPAASQASESAEADAVWADAYGEVR